MTSWPEKVIYSIMSLGFLGLFAVAQVPPTTLPALPTPVSAGALTQIILALIAQLPGIITAMGFLATGLVGWLNYRKLGRVEVQTDGHLSKMTALLAASVSPEVLQAMAEASTNTAAAVASAAVATHAAERVADRASDRADRSASIVLAGRRMDEKPLKVSDVATEAVADRLTKIEENTAATAANTSKDKDV